MKTTMMMMMQKSVVSVIHGDPTEMTCGQGDTRVQPGGHDDSPTRVAVQAPDLTHCILSYVYYISLHCLMHLGLAQCTFERLSLH